MKPAGHGQALREDDPKMLQIALGPAAVADQIIKQSGWRFFERAADIGRHPHFPASAAQKRRLDKVVAHDLAAKRRTARQARQSAMLHESMHPDDGVMAPVIA